MSAVLNITRETLNDQYLTSMIQKYAVNVAGAEAAGQSIYPVIQCWSGVYLVKAQFSGSLSKGTAISIGTDADIFISLSSTTPGSLANLYETLFNAVTRSGYSARKQNVSIGVNVKGYNVDLVPGRRQNQYSNEHSLYKRKTNTWIKTDVNKHINYVINSNRTAEIKLAKIWRQLHKLEFPSFYLEMAVIDSLKYARVGDTTSNFWKVLHFFRDNLASARYIDPANTNNVISDDLNSSQKRAVANVARASTSKGYWGEIVW